MPHNLTIKVNTDLKDGYKQKVKNIQSQFDANNNLFEKRTVKQNIKHNSNNFI